MKRKLIYLSLLLVIAVAFSFNKPAERYFEIAKNLDIFCDFVQRSQRVVCR